MPATAAGAVTICVSSGALRHSRAVHDCQVGEEAVVLEPIVGHGAQFSCVVLDTPRGPVALPPTEMGAYELEHDVLEAHLDMERREARFEVSVHRQEALCKRDSHMSGR